MKRLQPLTVCKLLNKVGTMLTGLVCDMPTMNQELPPELLVVNLDRMIAELHMLRVLVKIDERIGRIPVKR
jgi:hypothetical protein